MLKSCGKSAYNLGVSIGRVCAHPSTATLTLSLTHIVRCVQGFFIPSSILQLFPRYTPQNNLVSPLFEHIFYPVSTVPIINTTKIISKER